MSFPALVEARNKYNAKLKEHKEFMDSAKNEKGELEPDKKITKADGGKMSSVEFAEKVRANMEELKDLHDAAEALAAVEKAEKAYRFEHLNDGADIHIHADSGKKGDEPKVVPIGKQFIDSEAFKKGGRGSGMSPSVTLCKDYGLKTVFETGFQGSGAGWAPQAIRSGLVVPDAQRPIQLIDAIPSIPTTQAAYVYMEETTFTNNAAEVAEASPSTWGEAALAFTQRTENIQKIAVYIPVTDEQFEDVPGAEAWVNQRLPFMLRQRLDSQLIDGNGTAPNIGGFNTTANTSITTRTKAGGETNFDTAHKALTDVRVTGRATPNLFCFHPNDWQDYRLTRTADGIYILGNPSETGPMRLWGIPVSINDSLSEGTGLTGDFANYSLLVERRGIDMQVGWFNTSFLRGIKAIRADVRVALVVTRQEAFCLFSGLFP